MIFESIESFRVHKKMSVQDFCEITQISPSRYSKYKHGSFQFLMISDAVRLISAFTGEINVNILLKWTGEKPLPLSGKFPEFAFAYEPASDSGKSEQIFRRFLISTAFDVFKPEEALKLLAGMADPWNKSKIGLPKTENMYSLMYTLRAIRKIRFTDFCIHAQTVLTHFQRRRLPSRFTDVCKYESAFESGGIYLLSELMFLSMKGHLGIRLCG